MPPGPRLAKAAGPFVFNGAASMIAILIIAAFIGTFLALNAIEFGRLD